MITLQLTQEEAEALRTLGYFHVAMDGQGALFASMAQKLEDQGVAARSMKWHVNDFGHITIEHIL